MNSPYKCSLKVGLLDGDLIIGIPLSVAGENVFSTESS